MVKVCGLTDAVVPQVSGQTLPLVLGIVLPLPLLELLTGQILVLSLPLETKHRREFNEFKAERNVSLFLSTVMINGNTRYSQVSYTERKNSCDTTDR